MIKVTLLSEDKYGLAAGWGHWAAGYVAQGKLKGLYLGGATPRGDLTEVEYYFSEEPEQADLDAFLAACPQTSSFVNIASHLPPDLHPPGDRINPNPDDPPKPRT